MKKRYLPVCILLLFFCFGACAPKAVPPVEAPAPTAEQQAETPAPTTEPSAEPLPSPTPTMQEEPVPTVQKQDVSAPAEYSYATPEDAIYSFIDAVKKYDLDHIMQSFAYEDYVDGYDPEEPDAEIIAPITLDERTMEIAEDMGRFYIGCQLTPEDMDNLSDMDIADVASQIDPTQYQSMEIVRIDLPEKDEDEHNQRTELRISSVKLHRAEGWDYRTTLLSFNGNTYYCGFTFLIYSGEYQIHQLSCTVVPVHSTIATMPCSEEEYLEIIDI